MAKVSATKTKITVKLEPEDRATVKPLRPELKCTVERITTVTVRDLEEYIEKVTGHTFDCVCNQEWGNDSQHRFNVGYEQTSQDKTDWEAFKTTGKELPYGLHAILNGMCVEGYLNPGIYLITVCW